MTQSPFERYLQRHRLQMIIAYYIFEPDLREALPDATEEELQHIQKAIKGLMYGTE